MGVAQAAEKAFASLTSHSQELILSYVDGINAYAQDELKGNYGSVEHWILGLSFRPFTSTDVLVWTKMMR